MHVLTVFYYPRISQNSPSSPNYFDAHDQSSEDPQVFNENKEKENSLNFP
jgi:hypothetical protein